MKQILIIATILLPLVLFGQVNNGNKVVERNGNLMVLDNAIMQNKIGTGGALDSLQLKPNTNTFPVILGAPALGVFGQKPLSFLPFLGKNATGTAWDGLGLKLTNVANGTAATDAVNFGQLGAAVAIPQNQVAFGSATGTGITSNVNFRNINGKIIAFKDIVSNDYVNVVQHSGNFEVGQASNQKKMEFAVLANGNSIIQSHESGIGYNALILNPVNHGGTSFGTPLNRAKYEFASYSGGSAYIPNFNETSQGNTSKQFNFTDGGNLGMDGGWVNNYQNYQFYLQARNSAAASTYYDLLLQPLGGRLAIGTTTPYFAFENSNDNSKDANQIKFSKTINLGNAYMQNQKFCIGRFSYTENPKFTIQFAGIHCGGRNSYYLQSYYTVNSDASLSILCLDANSQFYAPNNYVKFYAKQINGLEYFLMCEIIARNSVDGGTNNTANYIAQVWYDIKNSTQDLTRLQNCDIFDATYFEVKQQDALFFEKDKTLNLKTVNLDNTATKIAALTASNKFVYRNASDFLSVINATPNLTGAGTTASPLDLSNTSVTAGTYTAPTLTIDAKGRVTSAVSGSNAYLPLSSTANQTLAYGNNLLSLNGNMKITSTAPSGDINSMAVDNTGINTVSTSGTSTTKINQTASNVTIVSQGNSYSSVDNIGAYLYSWNNSKMGAASNGDIHIHTQNYVSGYKDINGQPLYPKTHTLTLAANGAKLDYIRKSSKVLPVVTPTSSPFTITSEDIVVTQYLSPIFPFEVILPPAEPGRIVDIVNEAGLASTSLWRLTAPSGYLLQDTGGSMVGSSSFSGKHSFICNGTNWYLRY